MSIFIASLILILIGSTYSVLLTRKLAETFFLSVVTVIGILYCFGLINIQGCLLYGIYFIIVLSTLCIIFLIYTFVKNKNAFYNAEILKGCLLYALMLIFAIFINWGQVFHLWDEFSYWGTIVKYYFKNNALGTFEPFLYNTPFPSYFPGTGLFQYFFLQFSDQFKEHYLYIAMNVLYFSLFMPFVKYLFNKNKWVNQLFLLIIFLLIPLSTQTFYSELYVDTMLGAFFGFSFLYYFIYKYEESLYGIFVISAITFMLTITKDMGLLLSIGIIGIIIIDIIAFRRSSIKNFFIQKTGIIYKIKSFILILLPLISILFVKLSWTNLLKKSGIKSVWHIPTLNDIYYFFTRQIQDYQRESQVNFFNAMFERKIPCLNVNVVVFSIIFVMVVLICMIFICKKFSRIRIIIIALLLVLGLYAYQFVLAVMYVFSFSAYEAVILASYERYTSTYLIGMMFFITIFFISESVGQEGLSFSKKEKLIDTTKNINSMYLFISIILYSIVLINSAKGVGYTLLTRLLYPENYEIRTTTVSVNKWEPYFADKKIYIISQNDSFSYFKIQYELRPSLKYAVARHEVAPEPRKYDSWSLLVVSPEEWETYILTNEFNLLWIYKSDEILKNTYGHFFPYGIQEDMCYYVQNKEEQLILVPVIELNNP